MKVVIKKLSNDRYAITLLRAGGRLRIHDAISRRMVRAVFGLKFADCDRLGEGEHQL